MFEWINNFSLFSLHKRYIPALTLLALFATLTYKNSNDIKEFKSVK